MEIGDQEEVLEKVEWEKEDSQSVTSYPNGSFGEYGSSMYIFFILISTSTTSMP